MTKLAPIPLLNSHPMVTRSKNDIFKPNALITNLSMQELSYFIEALQKENWKKVMIEENEAFLKVKTWYLVSFPPNRKSMGYKWVFKLKKNLDGLVDRYKACLVAKGYLQTIGFNFTEIFSPVMKATSIKIILTIAFARGWKLRQLVVNNAFLNAGLQEEVYVNQPPRFDYGKYLAFKLHKANTVLSKLQKLGSRN